MGTKKANNLPCMFEMNWILTAETERVQKYTPFNRCFPDLSRVSNEQYLTPPLVIKRNSV